VGSTVSDAVVDRLKGWGISTIFGYPGDGINGLIGALQRDGSISFVQARHEEMAAFMATGHAKFSQGLGVCLATSGPGAIHLLNGLYDAKADHQPVLAIVGQQPASVMGGSYQQEVDLQTLYGDVARYVIQVAQPDQVRHVIDRAIRIALGERTVTCVILPTDLQDEPAKAPEHRHGTVHSGLGYHRPVVIPDEEQLDQAAEVLNAGSQVAILAGAGAIGARQLLVETADRLGAGLAKALLGKSVVPDDRPWVTGSIGLLGTEASTRMMAECDTLLMVGTGFPYAEFLPKEGQARAVQIDIDPAMLSLRYPVEVPLVGDAAETLRRLLPRLKGGTGDDWRRNIEAWTAEWWTFLDRQAEDAADPINPQLVFKLLSPLLPEDVILTADAGTAAIWYARHVRMRSGMSGSLSGGLASMGSGVPYAISAKFAQPGRPVVAMVGDGAMQMNGMAELITVARYWSSWTDPRLVVLVLNNLDLNMVSWEQRTAGSPRFEESQALPDVHYADFARSLGLGGRRIEAREDLEGGWQQAFEADRPFVLEVRTDPNVPPLPPRVNREQALNLGRAMAAGDADRAAIARHSVAILKDRVE
jgi:pyruvate dehydrogenase (quinone)